MPRAFVVEREAGLIGPDLDEHSDESAIKKAYKKAAMRWHPDRFSCKGAKQQKEAEEQFRHALRQDSENDYRAEAEPVVRRTQSTPSP